MFISAFYISFIVTLNVLVYEIYLYRSVSTTAARSQRPSQEEEGFFVLPNENVEEGRGSSIFRPRGSKIGGVLPSSGAEDGRCGGGFEESLPMIEAPPVFEAMVKSRSIVRPIFGAED